MRGKIDEYPGACLGLIFFFGFLLLLPFCVVDVVETTAACKRKEISQFVRFVHI